MRKMARARSDRKKMMKTCPQQTARFQAYDEPSKDVQKWTSAARTRVSVYQTKQKCSQICNPVSPAPKTDHLKQVTTQLKATEAQDRIRNMRLRHQHLKAEEINAMITRQIDARGAVRQEYLLKPCRSVNKRMNHKDNLDPLQRRVEEILEDKRF
ncbi:protein LKAAEAR1-like isoform X2 [Misgurnus anguillicaudatus]|uniref:protein LKAAEAR1-like isoform X2 n=1 Tax=Misgurnus anguillicaudatus TaxID=75329 RepID=UPI003CCFDE50